MNDRMKEGSEGKGGDGAMERGVQKNIDTEGGQAVGGKKEGGRAAGRE